MRKMKRLLLILMIAFFSTLFISARSEAQAASTPPIINLMKNQIDPKVVQIRDASLSYLVPALIVIGIIATWLDYISGRMNWKRFAIRIAVVILVLSNYTGPNNFRDALKEAADGMAALVTANNNPVEAVFEALYQMFRSLECGKQSTIAQTAAAVFMILTTPAGVLMVLFIVVTIVVGLLSLVFDVGTSILLMMLDILGPLILPLAILRTTSDIAWGWLYRYIEICLWRFLYALLMIAISTIYQLVVQNVFTPLCAIVPFRSAASSFNAAAASPEPITVISCLFSAMLIGVAIGVVSIFMLAKIPQIAHGIIEGVGMGVNPMPDVGAEKAISGEFRHIRRFGRGA
jgi:type IV secretory pathway VirB2 component (pilin)